jgi:hypothetical protein
LATKVKRPTVRRVKTKEDRKRPSVFMRLKTDENFTAHALFEPDPELEDNPGYFEYYDHWDQQGNTYVPCVGEDCPFCAANMNPSTRALTAWYFPTNEKGDQIKLFTMNFGTTEQTAAESDDEDGILGKPVKIRRMDDRGDYRVRIQKEKPLTKAQLKAILAEVEEMDLPSIVDRQLQTQLERLKAVDALEDDEDDDEEETPTRSKSKPSTRKGKVIEEEEDEDEDEDEEDEEEEEEEDEDEDEDEEEDDDDDDEDEEEDDEEGEEDEDEEDDEEEATQISGAYEIVKPSATDETFDLKDADGKKVKMWVNEGVEVDYEDYAKGTMVNVEAQQDDEGDWIITKIGKRRGRKPAAKK